jgi:activator of HSP90 ATPase
MSIEFKVSTIIKATPDEIYAAWLSSEGHTEMTGSTANVSDVVGEEFEAWDGYISGKNLELEPHNRILQAWRTVEFSEDEEDSLLEIILEPVPEGTKVIIHHTKLPADGMQYKQGWVDSYFTPMKEYFEK